MKKIISGQLITVYSGGKCILVHSVVTYNDGTITEYRNTNGIFSDNAYLKLAFETNLSNTYRENSCKELGGFRIETESITIK